MSEPYASVIIPTHDRASTLDLTLRSMCGQTIRDIEVIVAMDGATDAVKAVAYQAAQDDSRIRVLDFPKASGRGSENRSLAVRAARSEKIFYSDDDDLWFPNHVEKLGRALDDCDVVYSPTLSASISGAVHLGFVDYTIPDARERLSRGELRLVFDTHLAHRRSTYFDVGDPWAHDTDNVVVNLISALSSPGNVRWHALGTPTALSIHGATRRRFTPAERRTELEDWTIRLASSTPESLVATARVEWYVKRCLTNFKDRSFAGIDDFLPAIGIPANEDDPERAMGFTDDQRHVASITIDLHNKKAVRSQRLIEMLPYLLDPILGSTLNISQIENDLVQSLGLPETLGLVEAVRATHPYYNELQKLLKSSLLRKSGRHVETRPFLDIRHNAPVYFPAEIYTADGVAAEGLKLTNDAIDSALKDLSADGSYLPAHILLIRCLARNKDFPAAKSAAEVVFALSPKSDIVDYVKKLLG